MADLNIFGTTFSNASGFKIEDTEGNLRTFTEGSGVEPVQSDWNEEDTTSLAHVLNRPAIRADEGENSIVEGRIKDDSDATTYTIYITGDAGATTFSYTTEDTLPNLASLGSYGLFIYDNGTSNKYKYHKAIDLDTSNKTITFDSTLNTKNGSSFVNEPLRILYKQANIANGIFSHAEGSSVAIGNASHSEGIGTIALGSYSHAEGTRTNANGGYSHAEGLGTIAAGSSSHAEGAHTNALGYTSHSEGNRTIAQCRSNHVFGEFNLPDTGGSSSVSKGTYIEIVGNGTADTTRSNARTLDWNGNEVLAGKLTVGAGPTNNMDVATKQYVDTAVSGSGSDVMIVTVTDMYNEETGERTYSADKTFAEISAHINGGGIAVCKFNQSIYQLRVFVSDQITFSSISVDNNNYDTYIKVDVIMSWIVINDDNSIDVFETNGVPIQISNNISDGQILIYDEEEYIFKNSSIPAQNASIAIANNVITLTNASGQTSSITLPVYSGAVSGGAS